MEQAQAEQAQAEQNVWTKTAKEYGMEMREAGVKPPAPVIDLADMMSDDVKVYSIAGIDPKNAYLIERNGYGTVYVSPGYGDYRDAFNTVMPDSLTARDVDHLHPKSNAESGEYVALGHLDPSVNRGHGNRGGIPDQAIKGMNLPPATDARFEPAGASPSEFNDMTKSTAFQLAGGLTDSQRGRFVQNGYLRPMSELRTDQIAEISKESIAEWINKSSS